MRVTQLGTMLRAVGLLVGLATIAAILFRIDPTRISPFFIKVAIYKVAFIAAIALLVAGATLGRRDRSGRGPGTPAR